MLSPFAEDASPTIVGPLRHPISPPSANRAYMAVPPFLINPGARLSVPGHIIPTENPHSAHPIIEKTGSGEKDMRRYAHTHVNALIIMNFSSLNFLPIIPYIVLVRPMATEKVKGMSDPIITLQDSTVFMTIALDDDMYDVMSLKDHASKDDIMEELQTVNPKLLRLMADAKCGYIYRVIGSRSKKGFDITFSPKEVLNNRQVLDSKFEIVESDE